MRLRRRVIHLPGERDLPSQPPACSLQLENATREAVLRNIRGQLVERSRSRLVEELRQLGTGATLADFLTAADLELVELDTQGVGGSWTGPRRSAGFERRPTHGREAS